jgi:hypothetical protein
VREREGERERERERELKKQRKTEKNKSVCACDCARQGRRKGKKRYLFGTEINERGAGGRVTRERKEANPSGRAYVRASDLSPEQSQKQMKSGTMAIM